MGIDETGVGEQVPFPLPSSKYRHEEQLPYDVVLFSGLPHFCSLVCIQYNARKRKGSEKCGRPRNTYHMNDVWWMRGGCRGDIAHLQTHVINNRASEVEYYRCENLGSWLLLEHSMKSSTLFECGSLLRPPHIHQMSFMCVPRPSPFFTTLPLPYITLNANRKKNKTEKAWERHYTCSYDLVIEYISWKMPVWQILLQLWGKHEQAPHQWVELSFFYDPITWLY